MLRLSVNELSTFRWTFEEDVLNYHAAGFEAIGVWRPKLADYGEEKGVELLREHGLRISSLHWVGGFTGSDGRSYRESMHDAFDTIQLAADIGAETVTVITGGRAGHTRNHAHNILRTALRHMAEAAQAVGVQLALEPMHVGCAYDWSFLNTIPECLDIIAGIDNPHLGIVFDCYHVAQDPAALMWLESIVPYVRLVQLGDARHAPLGEQNRCLLGHGRVPLANIVSTFQKNGYRGFYEIEVVGQDVEHLKYEQILGQSRQAAKLWLPTP
ncbi:sugar phosphate isomerase/epimerase family protein [Aureliella helgolandensis]|uniref:Fructoselysine 3-epimerase n=1 Tax=Aureliella helgolandensis TaxID=2527968 RepID=A0A518GCA4_9BACT|nr:sugar phosphate isomerase/epimerase family protein [Aureliella helgolandensis]QDV26180.1 fructoselysine 3-epimerase [Aureliella helgolandensis]